MFEFFFKYPPQVFSKGSFVLLAKWPVWLLALCILGAAGGLAFAFWRRRAQLAPSFRGRRPAAGWVPQTALVALLLFLLWHPVLRHPTVKRPLEFAAVALDQCP